MKAFWLAALGVLALVLVSGCTQQPACSPPYVMRGSQCCLDQNSNGICDSFEIPPGNNQTAPPSYGPYQVKMLMQNTVPDSWASLPQSPARHYDGYQIYNYPEDDRYYDGGRLLLYSNYTAETVSCILREYWDSSMHRESTVKLTSQGAVLGTSVRMLFDKSNAPLEVRYDIDCYGDESGTRFQDTYLVGLRKP